MLAPEVKGTAIWSCTFLHVYPNLAPLMLAQPPSGTLFYSSKIIINGSGSFAWVRSVRPDPCLVHTELQALHNSRADILIKTCGLCWFMMLFSLKVKLTLYLTGKVFTALVSTRFSLQFPPPHLSTSWEVYSQVLAPRLKEGVIKLGLSILSASVITLQCECK